MNEQELSKVLICPVCRSNLNLRGKQFICPSCNENYKIKEDIPIMLSSSYKEYHNKYLELYNDNLIQSHYSLSSAMRCKYDLDFLCKNFDPHNKIIFDMGGGSASLSKKLAEYNTIYLIDISYMALSRLDKTPNIIPICADIQNVCLNVKSDLIICTEVLEHLSDPKSALESFHMSLKDGGLLYVSVPILNMPLKKVVSKIYRILYRIRDRNEHLRIYTSKTIFSELKSAGFSIKNIKYDHSIVPFSVENRGILNSILANRINIIAEKK